MSVAFSTSNADSFTAAAAAADADGVPPDPRPVAEHQLARHYCLSACVDWITEHAFARVALQFPDELLVDSAAIALWLQHNTRHCQFFILADTSYGSCCVDEISAEHVSADALVHFGRACHSGWQSPLAVHFVFPDRPLDVAGVAVHLARLAAVNSLSLLTLVCDDMYQHAQDDLCRAISAAISANTPAAAAAAADGGDGFGGGGSTEGFTVSNGCGGGGDGTCRVVGATRDCRSVQNSPLSTDSLSSSPSSPPAAAPAAGAVGGGDISTTADGDDAAAAVGGSGDESGDSSSSSSSSWRPLSGYTVAGVSGEQWRSAAGLVYVGSADSAAAHCLALSLDSVSSTLQRFWLYDPQHHHQQHHQHQQQQEEEEHHQQQQQQQEGKEQQTAVHSPVDWRSVLELDSVALRRTVLQLLRRRRHLVERARDARCVGILAGTLSVPRYSGALRRLRALLRAAGKRCYTLLVGRLTPAKLANFAQLDVLVLVACDQSVLQLERQRQLGGGSSSCQFLQPVVTPFEMQVACSLRPYRLWPGDGPYRTGFDSLFWPPHTTATAASSADAADADADVTDVSLISGRLRWLTPADGSAGEADTGGGGELVRRADMATVAHSGGGAAQLLAERSWRGLEPRYDQTPVAKATCGQTGIAAGYRSAAAVAAEAGGHVTEV